jgi:putative transposase
MDDALHKISRHIVSQLVKNGVGHLVLGHNKGWKDSINLGKVTNQNFTEIPYDRLISMLRYKCVCCGIRFDETEESHTSKCDALAFEEIGHHDTYLGKRKKRGLFQSSTGRLINADVNGALNIMRKVVGDSPAVRAIVDSGRLFRPRKVNDIYSLSEIDFINFN